MGEERAEEEEGVVGGVKGGSGGGGGKGVVRAEKRMEVILYSNDLSIIFKKKKDVFKKFRSNG